MLANVPGLECHEALRLISNCGLPLHHQVEETLCQMEAALGACFGDSHNGLLLLSVRSGAAVSMPGAPLVQADTSVMYSRGHTYNTLVLHAKVLGAGINMSLPTKSQAACTH